MKSPQRNPRLLIVSNIPLYKSEGGYRTLDLWCRDLFHQSEHVEKLGLAAPVEVGSVKGEMLPNNIEVIPHAMLTTHQQQKEVMVDYDVVQVAASGPKWDADIQISMAKTAEQQRKYLITSISSNRIKTTVMNAEKKWWPGRLKAWLVSNSISSVLKQLVNLSNGVLLTGQGLGQLADLSNKDVHIGTASWIEEQDVINPDDLALKMAQLDSQETIQLVVASRLERMKGVHLIIEALHSLKQQCSIPFFLNIFGEGPERASLERLVADASLNDCVKFCGTRTYPHEFLKAIRSGHLAILTNLNDEQPRLIFDACSQGVVPIVPDAPPYHGFGLSSTQFYRRGDPLLLAQTLQRAMESDSLIAMLPSTRTIALNHTIQSMHKERANWIKGILQKEKI